jgi:pSer/pThr/pTyr-binding forkhead associated (FHA) protein
MAELIVRYPDRTAEHFPLSRLRITIGRSARNDLCIPDPFASRVHAEVRHEGDEYFLQDLGSANGTLYNGSIVDASIQLTRGGRIQIGETEIVLQRRPVPAQQWRNHDHGTERVDARSDHCSFIRRSHDVGVVPADRRRAVTLTGIGRS